VVAPLQPPFSRRLKHALEVHEQVYTALDAQYTDFLKLCLQSPELDCFDIPRPEAALMLNKDEKARQQIVYAILIPMLEYAYLTYHGPFAVEIANLTQRQWPGWERYARSFMMRPAFREVWEPLSNEFDANFKNCMNALPTSDDNNESWLCDPWKAPY
jgi:hypothetical protein